MLMMFTPLTAFSWGAKGHDVIAKIAENHLTESAREKVHAILGGHDLVYYANWMDNLRNSPYWSSGYYMTGPWHYANVDEGYTYETMTKNPKGDIITALDTMIAGLKGGNLNDSLRLDYLRMVIHMVGDIHQPMHAGRLSDLGGNKIEVKWFDRKDNLHSIWDSDVMNLGHSWSYTEWVQQLDIIAPETSATFSGGVPREWFEETYQIAVKIYDSPKPSNVSTTFAYAFNWMPTIESQLIKAGYRLAEVLNEIFG